LSTKLSTEFYLEYFRILQSIQHPDVYHNTLSNDNVSPSRMKSLSKILKKKVNRPKSAPGLRKMSKIHKGRRATVDPERINGIKKNYDILADKKFIHKRKSYSPTYKRKSKRSKKSPKKLKNKIKIQENIETGDGDRFKLINFRIEHRLEREAVMKQTRAAVFIFNFWKFRKYYRHVLTQRRKKVSSIAVSIPQESKKHHSDMTSVKPDKIIENEDLKSYDNSPTPRSSKKYSTAVKKDSNNISKSEIIDDQDSEITKVLIHSTKAEENLDDPLDYPLEENKGTEENEVFREPKNLFTYEDEDKEVEKILSPHNPFEAMDDTIDAKDKVVHLSTINTDENLDQN
jgi:hypothetical protein